MVQSKGGTRDNPSQLSQGIFSGIREGKYLTHCWLHLSTIWSKQKDQRKQDKQTSKIGMVIISRGKRTTNTLFSPSIDDGIVVKQIVLVAVVAKSIYWFKKCYQYFVRKECVCVCAVGCLGQ